MSQCRSCRTQLRHLFVDRGKSPLCESFLAPDQLNAMAPFYASEKINETRPDYVLILPWKLKDEIMAQLADVREWGRSS